jgi:hypothetical protein
MKRLLSITLQYTVLLQIAEQLMSEAVLLRPGSRSAPLRDAPLIPRGIGQVVVPRHPTQHESLEQVQLSREHERLVAMADASRVGVPVHTSPSLPTYGALLQTVQVVRDAAFQ